MSSEFPADHKTTVMSSESESESESSTMMSSSQDPKDVNNNNKDEKQKEKRMGNFDPLLNIKLTEGDEDLFDDDGTDCGLCLLFKAGGCKKETIPYSKCIKEAKTVDDLSKCDEFEKALVTCMLTKPAYYAPLVQALYAMGMHHP